MILTYDILKKIVPALPKNADVFIPYLNEVIAQFEINTPRRLAGFIANAAHETGGFMHLRERGGEKYLSKYDTGALAKKLGNTPEADGDGIFYAGRGIFQTTGKEQYNIIGKELGLDLLKNPDLLATPQYAVKSAAIFWRNIKGNGLMDLPDSWRSKTLGYSPFQYLVYRICGGQNGYTERLQYFNRALQVLS